MNQYKVKVEKWFTPDHPAYLSMQNNMALLL